MKVNWIVPLILGSLVTPLATANQVAGKRVKAERQNYRFLQNFDEKIKSLEDYQVTFVQPGARVHKRIATRIRRDDLRMKLIPAKKRVLLVSAKDPISR